MKRYICLAVIVSCAISSSVSAAINIALWPINQHINSGEKSSILWLKNAGKDNADISVRVLEWHQKAGGNYFSDQNDINIVPSIIGIMPGDKAFVRFFVSPSAHPVMEQAYRIIVDELPHFSNTGHDKVALRMRYVLPLFVAGSKTPLAWQQKGDNPATHYPDVTWHISADKGHNIIVFQNSGPVHARLSDISLKDGQRQHMSVSLHPGLLGYILPGETLSMPLPASVLPSGKATLAARFFDADSQATVIPRG